MDALDATAIQLELTEISSEQHGANTRTSHTMPTITVLQTVDSTNSEAAREAGSHESGAVWLAEQQTAGRGRRGRQWLSPQAANIYMSMLWHLPDSVASSAGVSLAVGVAISDALRVIGFDRARLKWPNDVLVDGKKLGGILLEMHTLKSGAQVIIIGVGLNVSMPADEAKEIDQAWTDLCTEHSPELSRNALAAQLISSIQASLLDFEREGFAAFKSRWQTLDALAGQQLVLSAGTEQITGRAAGLADDGALQLETGQGVQSFYAGEISVRVKGSQT